MHTLTIPSVACSGQSHRLSSIGMDMVERRKEVVGRVSARESVSNRSEKW